MKNFLAVLTVLSAVLTSCSVYQEIQLDSSGSGQMTGRVLLDDFYLATLRDLTDLSSPAENGRSPMEPDSIAGELRKNPLFLNVLVTAAGPGLYQGGLEFHDIEELFHTPEGVSGSVAAFQKGSGSSTLTIRINRENFQELFRLFPVLQDPGFQYFLPEESITRQEYKEMLLFLFEDSFQGSEEELETRIEMSSLNLIIVTSGSILSQQGGTLEGEKRWKVEVPLLDLLLHEKELYYSVTFR